MIKARWIVTTFILAGFLLFAFLVTSRLFPVWHTLPDEIRVFPDQQVEFEVGPLFSLKSLSPSTVELRLLGWLPMQRSDVRVVDRIHVVPGGQAVGILLSSHGLVVARTTSVLSASGQRHSPASGAGIQPGDVLLRAGNVQITHPFDLESIADEYGRRGEAIPLTLMRRGKEIQLDVTPVEAVDPIGYGTRYMLGLFLKDPAAGVGTLTFWHPPSGAYGALGHAVSDGDQTAWVNDGRIVSAHIHGVHPGMRGRPGEKIGFFESNESLGSIEKNTPYGIYGRLFNMATESPATVPVALTHEIKEGPAQILTVLDGDRVEKFDIMITGVNAHAASTGRGLIIEVTDPRLLEKTNGIVQGMSGSPILQDGKLIGAVTHVFINNPHRGYGILAEWMVYEAGILEEGIRSEAG